MKNNKMDSKGELQTGVNKFIKTLTVLTLTGFLVQGMINLLLSLHYLLPLPSTFFCLQSIHTPTLIQR